MKKWFLIIAGFLLLIAVFLAPSLNKRDSKTVNDTQSSSKKITIYKSPSCGCCMGFGNYLKENDYEVEIEEIENMDEIKDKYGIPYSMQSCHTSVVAGYFIEGHMPLEVIEKLLAEKPDIDGISLPGMPPGSPGMPGVKTEDFIIYSLKDGQISEYTRI